MPTFYKTTLITKKEAAKQNQSDGVVNGDDLTGLLLVATAKVTIDTGVAANDTIQIMDLPLGAVLIPQLSSVQCANDPGTTLTLNVGDTGTVAQPGVDAVAADPDRYAAGIVLSAGGLVGFCSTGVPDGAINPFRPQVPQRIVGVVASTNTPTAVDLVFTIVYRAKG